MLADSLFLASISAFLHTSVLLSEVGIAGNSECHRSANKHISMRCVVVAYSSVVSIVMCHVMSTQGKHHSDSECFGSTNASGTSRYSPKVL